MTFSQNAVMMLYTKHSSFRKYSNAVITMIAKIPKLKEVVIKICSKAQTKSRKVKSQEKYLLPSYQMLRNKTTR